MFVRRLKNRLGSTSVQVIQKINGRYKVLKTGKSLITKKPHYEIYYRNGTFSIKFKYIV